MLTHNVSPCEMRVCTPMSRPYADTQLAASLMGAFDAGDGAARIDLSLVPLVIVNRRILLHSYGEPYNYEVWLYSRDGLGVAAWGYYSCGGFLVRDRDSGIAVKMIHPPTYNTTKMRLRRARKHIFG
jgi:hypothetical protein